MTPNSADFMRRAAGVAVVSRDRSSKPVQGLYSICYINAFQTQAEETKWWKANHPDVLLKTASGKLVEDQNWPGEEFSSTRPRAKNARRFLRPRRNGCGSVRTPVLMRLNSTISTLGRVRMER